MNEAPEKRDWLIGATAYQVIRQSFGSSGTGDKECFRVKNLTHAESVCLLERWTENKDRDGLSHIRVVVAADAGDLFPPRYRAAEGATITSYRNNKEPLLYIETKVESDEQGLQNLFTLRDVNFLDGSFDDEAFAVPVALVEEALDLCSAGIHPAKDGLIKRILQVLRGLQEHSIALPVRKFASFALAAADALSKQKGNMEASQLDSLIGNNLIHLDIFADDFWRTSASPSRVSRRLSQNLLHAELANTQSADLDQEKLAEQCRTMKFRSADGQELSAADNEDWRWLCREYCINPRREIREQIPYFIFEQLFSRDLKGLKLGERVRGEIDQSDPSRIEEFDSQSFQGGMDRRERDECQRFLEAQPDDDGFPALRDLLSKQTRRMVEKVAYPNPERFRNPLLKLAEIASTMRETIGGDVKDSHTLDMRLGRNADLANPSIGLLAFIFGPTLKSVIEASQLSTDGFELSADSRFLAPDSPPSLLTQENEEEENDEVAEGHTEQVEWHPVPIELALLNKTGDAVEVESALEWAPSDMDRMSLLWLMLCADDRPASNKILGVPKELNFEAWVQETVARVTSLKSSERGEIMPERLRDHHVSQLLTLKSALEEKVHGTGFTAEALNDHFDSWSQLLHEMKTTFVPDGKADPTLEVMLGYECMLGAKDNSYMMLGTHPIKLRWLAQYLKMSEKLAVSALDGALPLNRQNRVMYLSWMSALSPQQQPAIHVSPRGKRLLAGVESGLTEEYYPPNASPETSHSEALSPHITSEIVGQVIAYLEAHPYKKDGITILLVSPVAPKFAADLVRGIRKGEWLNLPIVLHLATPKNLWEMSSRYFEEVPSENRMAGVNGIFPPLELRLHELSSDKDPAELFDDLVVDLSIIPQFFHGAPEMQENTEPSLEDGSGFDPLLDNPTFIYGGTNGGAMSVSQLPRNPDLTLASWSSIVVRQHRHKPVSPQQPENMDFLELRLNFQQASDLFTELHERSHWVITLEKYITREQIEQLDSGPEILTVRDRVGPGGMFTLIVSSNAGRKFIVRRLKRKLATIVTKAGGAPRCAGRELAQRIYDETREIAPGLALKAMGVSRVTEEILGLAVGRSFVEKRFPPSLEKGLVAWISLDEHADWFGGSNSTRADLCRITLAETDNGLEVELLALETKLRQAGYDPHGVDQVTSTMQLFTDMMPGEAEGNELIDAKLWREMILSAIETAKTAAVRFEGEVINDLEGQPHRIPVSMRNDFRDGKFRVRALEGIYCICTYSDSGGITIEKPSEYDNLTICRASGIELLALIAGDDGDKEMIEPAPPIERVGMPVSEPATSNQPDNGHQQHQPQQIPSHGEQDREQGATPDEDIKKQHAQRRSGRLSRHELERRYQKILDTFEEFKISVRQPEDLAERFLEGPASVLYRIRPGHGVEPRKISEKADVLRLKLSLEEEQRICFSIDRGFITIDVPKSAQDRYFITASELWENWHAGKNELQVPIGEDRSGRLVSLNLSSNNSPHLLIGGTTGSGKSEALNTILAGLTKHYSPETLRLMLVDPKGTELEHLSESPHLEGNIGWDDKDACSLLNRAVQEMHRRYDVFKAARARSLPEFNEARLPEKRIPWWLIVLDEYADLTSDPDSKKEIEAHLRRLAQKARAAGIHLVIATQKPSAEVISTNLRSNLPAQLALKVKNATESRVVMDEAGAESLNGMGDAFLKSEGKLTRVQCAKV